ncbi:hypothetical protein Agabi119p4_10389 [Agaricus bisporus var. burnettii]|uniref:Uncharacterized protein n=1 Tax=Agaricus bisporus var. burnettii TaxID=192524 RepID=A0A8H7C2V6_AGABI|nr:hypothetical protein Agabi119p4_10389 [Agaricus bisporus var. burnettii]
MLCGLYFLIMNSWVIQDAYIKHAEFPGGPYEYEYSTFLTQPAIGVGLVCVAVVDISTAAIQIWRLSVVWSGTRYVRIVVIFLVLFHTQYYVILALRIRTTFLDLTLAIEDFKSQNAKPGTAELALQAIIIILPTILIAGFLAFESHQHKKLIGESQPPTSYMNVVAMLIESYAVESTWTIAIVILFNLSHPTLQFFGDTQPYIEIIANLLVLYRVASGRAYGSQRGGESQNRRDHMSSLHWNRTNTHSDAVSGTDTNIHPPGNKLEPEILLVQGSPA